MYHTSPNVNKGLKEVFVHEQFASFYKVNQCCADHHVSVCPSVISYTMLGVYSAKVSLLHINGFHLPWYFEDVTTVKSVGSWLS